jgi:hypothetical protein
MRSTVTDASQCAAAGVYIRFCFPDTATADAFRDSFGGKYLTHIPAEPKPRASATSSDSPAVTREAEEEWGKRGRR